MSFLELPPMPSPSSPPVGVTEDGKVIYGELEDGFQEHIQGIDPATGEPDGRFDGRITASVPIQFVGPFLGEPDPNEPRLVEAVRPTSLVIARDLGVGLADLSSSEQLERDATAAKRRYDPRRQR